jgi:superfamily II DNA or RNA helicase
VFEHLTKRGMGRQLVAIPTGAGKTYLSVAIARAFERALFIVPRQELLHQARAAYEQLTPGASAGIIWGKQHEVAPHFTVATIQSLHGRLDRFRADAFDLLLIDEAHHAAARQWRDALDHFHPELLLGLSATPERLDGAPLSNWFDVISYQMTVKQAVQRKILVPPRALEVRTGIDLDGVKRHHGRFDEAELTRTINTPERNRLVVRAYLQHGEDRPALAFTAGVEHAEALAEAFRDAGVAADSVAGSDADRRERVARFERGETRVLANAQLLTEGYDFPPVACVLMTRPTESRALFTQAVGRALRLAPNKTDALLVDFHDTSRKHSLAGLWDFWGSKRRATTLKEPVDLLERDELHERQLEGFSGEWNLELYANLLDVLTPPPDLDAIVVGAARWHAQPASEKQLASLLALGYDTRLDWTRGQAAAVIGEQPITNGQRTLLLAYGFDTIGFEWTRGDASRAIDAAKAAGKAPDWTLVQRLRQPHQAPVAPRVGRTHPPLATLTRARSPRKETAHG